MLNRSPIHALHLAATRITGRHGNNIRIGIDRDEDGNPVASDVWTGTLQDGTAMGLDCGGWTSSVGTGHCGAALQSNFRWTNNITPPCGAGLRLYCFEDGA